MREKDLFGGRCARDTMCVEARRQPPGVLSYHVGPKLGGKNLSPLNSLTGPLFYLTVQPKLT